MARLNAPPSRLKATLISASLNVKPPKAGGGKVCSYSADVYGKGLHRAGLLQMNSHRILLSAEVQLPPILSQESFEEKKTHIAIRKDPQAKAKTAWGQPSDNTTLPSALQITTTHYLEGKTPTKTGCILWFCYRWPSGTPENLTICREIDTKTGGMSPHRKNTVRSHDLMSWNNSPWLWLWMAMMAQISAHPSC